MIIIATTNKEVRRIEYLRGSEEYSSMLGQLHDNYGDPHVIGKEENLYSLYYDHNFDNKFGDSSADIYALKINKDTGKVTRKVYYEGNTSNLTVDYEVVVTGEFLDEPNTYTLYQGEGATLTDAITMSKPFIGTTYKDGLITRVTNYIKKEID